MVASIVMANKDKLFNVAIILFQIKEYIQFDNERVIFDQGHSSQLTSLQSMFGGMQYSKEFQDERIRASNASHRSESLEGLFLYYQMFMRTETIEDEAKNRQEKLWELLDVYYEELPDSDNSNKATHWRFCLARMDRRKMEITTEIQDGNIAINFKTELTPELQEISETTKTKQEEDYKYIPLKLWGELKLCLLYTSPSPRDS